MQFRIFCGHRGGDGGKGRGRFEVVRLLLSVVVMSAYIYYVMPLLHPTFYGTLLEVGSLTLLVYGLAGFLTTGDLRKLLPALLALVVAAIGVAAFGV